MSAPDQPPMSDAEAEAAIAAAPAWSRPLLRAMWAMTLAARAEKARLEAEIRLVAAEQRDDSRLH